MPNLDWLWSDYNDEIKEKKSATLDLAHVGELTKLFEFFFNKTALQLASPTLWPEKKPQSSEKESLIRGRDKRSKLRKSIVLRDQVVIFSVGKLRGRIDVRTFVLQRGQIIVAPKGMVKRETNNAARGVLRSKRKSGEKKIGRSFRKRKMTGVTVSGKFGDYDARATFYEMNVVVTVDVGADAAEKMFFTRLFYPPLSALAMKDVKLIFSAADHASGTLPLKKGPNFQCTLEFGTNLKKAYDSFLLPTLGGAVAGSNAGLLLDLKSTPFALKFDGGATLIQNASLSVTAQAKENVRGYEARLRGLWKVGGSTLPVTSELPPDTGVLVLNFPSQTRLQINRLADLAPLLNTPVPDTIRGHANALRSVEKYELTGLSLSIDIPARVTTDVTLTVQCGKLDVDVFTNYIAVRDVVVTLQCLHPHDDALRQVTIHADATLKIDDLEFFATFLPDGTIRGIGSLGDRAEDAEDEDMGEQVTWKRLLGTTLFKRFIEAKGVSKELAQTAFVEFHVIFHPLKKLLQVSALAEDGFWSSWLLR